VDKNWIATFLVGVVAFSASATKQLPSMVSILAGDLDWWVRKLIPDGNN